MQPVDDRSEMSEFFWMRRRRRKLPLDRGIQNIKQLLRYVELIGQHSDASLFFHERIDHPSIASWAFPVFVKVDTTKMAFETESLPAKNLSVRQHPVYLLVEFGKFGKEFFCSFNRAARKFVLVEVGDSAITLKFHLASKRAAAQCEKFSECRLAVAFLVFCRLVVNEEPLRVFRIDMQNFA